MAKKTVVIFEDDKRQAEKLGAAFNKKFRGSGTDIFIFESKTPKNGGSELFEDRLAKDLDAAKLGEIVLFVTDRDLSKTPGYAGFSEAVVSKISDSRAIPMCIYSQAESSDALRRARHWSDFKIILDISRGDQRLAEECRIIWSGFERIGKACQGIKSVPNASSAHTPAEILARVLGEPDLKDRIALYGAGDQHMLAEIFPFYERGKSKRKRWAVLQLRMTRALGYWLWDSILRFPGLILNEVAAASYLGIAENDFKKDKVRDLFRSALYAGPFAGIDALWWRHKVDGILATSGFKSGLDFVRKKGAKGVSSCACFVDRKPVAGYYCMVQKKPVCAKHSHSNVSWFPPGADLARISKPVFDELAPWLGLYS